MQRWGGQVGMEQVRQGGRSRDWKSGAAAAAAAALASTKQLPRAAPAGAACAAPQSRRPCSSWRGPASAVPGSGAPAACTRWPRAAGGAAGAMPRPPSRGTPGAARAGWRAPGAPGPATGGRAGGQAGERMPWVLPLLPGASAGHSWRRPPSPARFNTSSSRSKTDPSRTAQQSQADPSPHPL